MFNSENIKITKVADYASSAGTAVDGTALDMSGFEGVIFVARIATANAGNYLKAQEGDTSSPTADLAGSKVAAASDGQVVVLEVRKPKKRYIRCNIVRAGANTVTGDVYAIQYGNRTPPNTNGDVRVGLESPDAGTP